MSQGNDRSRDDDTVQTILARAQRRARSVSQHCARVSAGLRAPAPGPVVEVDPERLAKLQPAPRDAQPEDDRALRVVASIGLHARGRR